MFVCFLAVVNQDEMSKEISKLLNELKDELRNEWKIFRVTLERDIRSDIRDMRTDFKGVKDGMDFINLEFEDIKKKLETVLKENSELKRENGALSRKCEEMEKRLSDCQDRLTEAEQYSRNVNLEIKGVLRNDNEDLTDVIAKLGESIGEPIVRADVALCHRVPTRDSGKSNIIVQFVSRSKRDAVLVKARKMRLTNTTLGLGSEEPVFVNEHLCRALKRTLGKAIAKKRQCNWKFVWVRNGKIFARKNESASVITIDNEAAVDKIC